MDALAENAIMNGFNALPNLAIGFAVPIPATLVGGPMLGVSRLFGAAPETALAVGQAGYTVSDYATAIFFPGSHGRRDLRRRRPRTDSRPRRLAKAQVQLDDAQVERQHDRRRGHREPDRSAPRPTRGAQTLGCHRLANLATIGIAAAREPGLRTPRAAGAGRPHPRAPDRPSPSSNVSRSHRCPPPEECPFRSWFLCHVFVCFSTRRPPCGRGLLIRTDGVFQRDVGGRRGAPQRRFLHDALRCRKRPEDRQHDQGGDPCRAARRVHRRRLRSRRRHQDGSLARR